MAAAVNGNERNPSYDCQWMFDSFGSTALKVGKMVKWSIIVVPSGITGPIANLFQGMNNSRPVSLIRSYTPGIISEGLCAFGQGIVRDVKWLFNEPAKEDFGFGSDVEAEDNQAEIAHREKIQRELQRIQVAVLSAESPQEDNDSPQAASNVGQARGVTFQKSEVLAAIKKCEENTREARRCAQRVALVGFSLIIYMSLVAYYLKK